MDGQHAAVLEAAVVGVSCQQPNRGVPLVVLDGSVQRGRVRERRKHGRERAGSSLAVPPTERRGDVPEGEESDAAPPDTHQSAQAIERV